MSALRQRSEAQEDFSAIEEMDEPEAEGGTDNGLRESGIISQEGFDIAADKAVGKA